jgi:hypothetical protein
MNLPTLTKEQIESCIRLGRFEWEANKEYATNRFDPEKGGPALKALIQARKEHSRLFEETEQRASSADSACAPTPRPDPSDMWKVLLQVQRAMAESDQAPDISPLRECQNPIENWFDPRRTLATDIWRVLAGLPLKFP